MKTKEKTHWKDVTADMMSEEEMDGGEYILHHPSWRSPFLNSFLTIPENRLIKKHGKSLAKPLGGTEVPLTDLLLLVFPPG